MPNQDLNIELKEIELVKHYYLIGRSKNEPVCDIILDFDRLSRGQCEIYLDELEEDICYKIIDGYTVPKTNKRKHSANGTFVNGQRISDIPTTLESGDFIQFHLSEGNILQIMYRIESEEPNSFRDTSVG